MTYEFYLCLSREQLLNCYRGHARQVQVRDRNGILIRLGVDKLTPFVGHAGIAGWFRLQTDSHHRFISLTALG